MRLSTRTHGIIDYVVGALLLATPFVLGFGPGVPAGWIAISAGIVLITNALLTDFELGRMRTLQIPVHLWIDGVLGVFLAVSPWVLAFDRTAWIPHLAAGLLIIIVAVVTQTVPGYDRRSDAATTG